MQIRPETTRDYSTIMDIHVRAFGNRLDEALIVTMKRDTPDYDPDLSLVAEINGKVVGHALFNPHTIRLCGQDVRAVNLAPIGVYAEYQKQGIGSALIEAGHTIAQKKGYALSFLLGHSDYYPRFGYQTHVFGASSVTIEASHVAEPVTRLVERNPTPDDIPTLLSLWEAEESAVDFAIRPTATFFEWVSPNPNIADTVYERDGEIIGYTRIHEHEGTTARVFLAKSPADALVIVGQMMTAVSEMTLPLHPYSQSASVLGLPKVEAWIAAMACPLVVNGVYNQFKAELQAGQRVAGRPIWGTAFDLAE